MNKDKIIDILRSLGFMPEEIGDGSGYSIENEGISIIYSVEDDDSGSISFIVPGLVKVEEYNREEIQSAVLHILEQLKYVQCTIMFGEYVWLSYQHYIGEREPDADTIEHMIRVLAVATARFHKLLEEDENEE